MTPTGNDIQRGDVVVCILPSDHGKPRPAVVVQSDLFNETHASLTLCPVTSHLVDAPLFRLPLPMTPENGLSAHSEIMVDKIATVRRERVARRIGRLTREQTRALDRALKLWLGLTPD